METTTAPQKFRKAARIEPKRTTEDKIAAYMVGECSEESLTPKEKEVMQRWIAIWSLLRNYHSPSQAVETHMKQCKEQGKPINRATAYYDLRHATELWGNYTRISRQAQLILMQDYQMDCLKMAFEEKDLKAINTAIANLVKISEQTEPFEQIESEAHTYVLELHLHNQQGEAQSRKISLDKLNELKKSDYHEVIEAVEGDELDAISMRRLLENKQENGADSTEAE